MLCCGLGAVTRPLLRRWTCGAPASTAAKGRGGGRLGQRGAEPQLARCVPQPAQACAVPLHRTGALPACSLTGRERSYPGEGVVSEEDSQQLGGSGLSRSNGTSEAGTVLQRGVLLCGEGLGPCTHLPPVGGTLLPGRGKTRHEAALSSWAQSGEGSAVSAGESVILPGGRSLCTTVPLSDQGARGASDGSGTPHRHARILAFASFVLLCLHVFKVSMYFPPCLCLLLSPGCAPCIVVSSLAPE